ncbi:uncharacterized protein LOC144659252 [Oculina patagonica]
MAVAFANIFMAKIENELLRQSSNKPILWKRFIDNVFTMWDKNEIDEFLLEANSFHPTIKFTADISGTETTFLVTIVYKGDRFNKESILDVRTHYKPTETFQYTNYHSYHPPGESCRPVNTLQTPKASLTASNSLFMPIQCSCSELE